MQRKYTTPEGRYYRVYADMLTQSHLLIAGATGSGKSTVVNGIMATALYQSPATVRFILIDPKGTELDEYRHLPHVIRYAQTMQYCVDALHYAMELTRTRFSDMKRKKLRMYNGSDVYIIIDELMYFTNQPQYKRQTMQLLQDILVISRAARIHVIACTQNPTTATIPATLRCNFDARLGLRTATAQDSRNIIGVRGCEKFPNPRKAGRALGYYMRGADMDLYDVPRVDDAERARLIKYWICKAGRGRLRLFS